MTIEQNALNKKTARKRSYRRVKKGIAAILAISVLAAGGISYQEGVQAKAAAQEKLDEARQTAAENVEAMDKAQDYIDQLESANEELREENKTLQYKVESLHREVSRGYSGEGQEFVITAYDLSVESCGKGASHPAYGVTASGVSLAGHSLESARAIAVDPNVIPIGSKVRISFSDKEMQKYNGIYTAVDTGGAIKGNRIDLFAGENAGHLARHIGRRTARVQIV